MPMILAMKKMEHHQTSDSFLDQSGVFFIAPRKVPINALTKYANKKDQS